MRRWLLVPILLPLACTHKPAAGESIAEVCRRENHKKTVTVSGYLVPPTATLGCKESCSMTLVPRRNERDGVYVTFPVGTGPRTMNAIASLKGNIPGEVRSLSTSDF